MSAVDFEVLKLIPKMLEEMQDYSLFKSKITQIINDIK